jgi:hypothetical protein
MRIGEHGRCNPTALGKKLAQFGGLGGDDRLSLGVCQFPVQVPYLDQNHDTEMIRCTHVPE